MFAESLADGGGGIIGIQVILLLSERETALTYAYDIGLAIHHIGTYTYTEIVAGQTVQVHLHHEREYIFTLTYSLYAVNPGPDGSQSLILTTCRVKHQFVEVCYLLRVGTVLMVGCHHVINNTFKLLAVILCQLVERAEPGILGCKRMGRIPAAIGKLVEIISGHCGHVKILHLDTYALS